MIEDIVWDMTPVYFHVPWLSIDTSAIEALKRVDIYATTQMPPVTRDPNGAYYANPTS